MSTACVMRLARRFFAAASMSDCASVGRSGGRMEGAELAAGETEATAAEGAALEVAASVDAVGAMRSTGATDAEATVVLDAAAVFSVFDIAASAGGTVVAFA